MHRAAHGCLCNRGEGAWPSHALFVLPAKNSLRRWKGAYTGAIQKEKQVPVQAGRNSIVKYHQYYSRRLRMLLPILIGLLSIATVTTATATSAGAAKVQPTVPSLRQPAVAPAALSHYELHFQNGTSDSVDVALMYRDTSQTCDSYGGWATAGWWTIGPGADAYVLSTQNRYVYFYARSRSGTEWTGTGHYMYVDTGKRFRSCRDIGTSTWGRVGLRTIHLGPSFNVHTVHLNP